MGKINFFPGKFYFIFCWDSFFLAWKSYFSPMGTSNICRSGPILIGIRWDSLGSVGMVGIPRKSNILDVGWRNGKRFRRQEKTFPPSESIFAARRRAFSPPGKHSHRPEKHFSIPKKHFRWPGKHSHYTAKCSRKEATWLIFSAAPLVCAGSNLW